MAIRDREAEYPEYDRDEDDWRRYEFPRYVESPDQGLEGLDGGIFERPSWMQGKGVNDKPLPDRPPERPSTELEAIMQAAPGDAPEESYEELHARLEGIRSVLDSGVLDEQEQEVIGRLFFQGQSLRDVGLELGIGKTTVASIRDRAFETIKEHLT